jgi:hypothetical protein
VEDPNCDAVAAAVGHGLSNFSQDLIQDQTNSKPSTYTGQSGLQKNENLQLQLHARMK